MTENKPGKFCMKLKPMMNKSTTKDKTEGGAPKSKTVLNPVNSSKKIPLAPSAHSPVSKLVNSSKKNSSSPSPASKLVKSSEENILALSAPSPASKLVNSSKKNLSSQSPASKLVKSSEEMPMALSVQSPSSKLVNSTKKGLLTQSPASELVKLGKENPLVSAQSPASKLLSSSKKNLLAHSPAAKVVDSSEENPLAPLAQSPAPKLLNSCQKKSLPLAESPEAKLKESSHKVIVDLLVDSPEPKRLNSPKKQMPNSPKKQMLNSPKKHRLNSPKKQMLNSPKKQMLAPAAQSTELEPAPKHVPRKRVSSSGHNSEDKELMQALHVDAAQVVGKLETAVEAYKAKTFFKPNLVFLRGMKSGIAQMEAGLHKIQQTLDGKPSKEAVTSPLPPSPPVSVVSTSDTSLNNMDVQTVNGSSLTNGTNDVINGDINLENDVLPVAIVNEQPTNVETSGSRVNKRKTMDCQAISGANIRKTKRSRRSLLSSFVVSKVEVETKVIVKKEEPVEAKVEEVEEKEFEVEKIIDYNRVKGVGTYLVRWRGYKAEDDTWEPYENLTGCETILDSFIRVVMHERFESNSPDEFKELQLPSEPDLSKTLRDAVWGQITVPRQEDVLEALPLLLTKKIRVKLMEELQEDVSRLLVMKDLAKHKKCYEELQHQVVLLECKKQRDMQEAELRRWQREMSRVCNDPAPLTVVNDVDLQLPPKDFVYINQYVAGKGIVIPTEPAVGCHCTDCASTQNSCCPKQMSSHFAYTKHGRLKVSVGTAIYECNKVCACAKLGNCINRVVQSGRKIQLSIFRTPNNRGWGVKAGELIRAGSFVTEYVGEVISSEEAERRGRMYDARGCTYLFDLDYNRGDANPYTVDAAKYGNVSHFINHCCDPNLVVFNVWVNCLDPDMPKLALFATREIRKGEEISFDYNASVSRNSTKDGTEGELGESDLLSSPTRTTSQTGTMDLAVRKTPKRSSEGTTECHCGAANCRKVFF